MDVYRKTLNVLLSCFLTSTRDSELVTPQCLRISIHLEQIVGISAIVNFELGLFTAQSHDRNAGKLGSNGAVAGPVSLAAQAFYIGINDPIDPLNVVLNRPDLGFNPFHDGFTPVIFRLFDMWSNPEPTDSAVIRARASIARGQAFVQQQAD